MPNTLWVWDMRRLRVAAVLHQLQPIKQVVRLIILHFSSSSSSPHAQAWHPTRDVIALISSNNKVHFWSLSGAYCVDIPYHG